MVDDSKAVGFGLLHISVKFCNRKVFNEDEPSGRKIIKYSLEKLYYTILFAKFHLH